MPMVSPSPVLERSQHRIIAVAPCSWLASGKRGKLTTEAEHIWSKEQKQVRQGLGDEVWFTCLIG